MKQYFKILSKIPLFNGVGDNIEKILLCLNPTEKSYDKDSFICMTGDPLDSIGIIISGSVKIIKEDIDGDINILAELNESDIFGEAFVCAGLKQTLVSVQAAENCKILFIEYKSIIGSCSSSCDFHTSLIENLLRVISLKNIMLNQKMDIIAKKSTREKLLAYFATQKNITKTKMFTIPFNRTELAAFLCVDRSAMTRELSNMRNDGIIDFDKNTFKLL